MQDSDDLLRVPTNQESKIKNKDDNNYDDIQVCSKKEPVTA